MCSDMHQRCEGLVPLLKQYLDPHGHYACAGVASQAQKELEAC